MTSPTEALADFEMSHFTAGGSTRVVYRLGAGPAVLVLSEIPGITPLVAAFARQVAARGHRVVLPHLFGRDGHSPNNSEYRKTIQEVCISREFTLFATKKSSRITKWLNELAQYEHEANGGPGVGVVGMCLTGGFALAMMVDPVVGREAVYKRVAGLADGLESITLDLHHVGVIDGNIYMERTDRFVYRGKDGWTPVVGVLEFEGSLIKVWREYYDRHHLLSAMGLTEDFDQSTR